MYICGSAHGRFELRIHGLLCMIVFVCGEIGYSMCAYIIKEMKENEVIDPDDTLYIFIYSSL